MTASAHDWTSGVPAKPRAVLPARSRAPRTVRINRVLLAGFGLLLLLGGVAGLLAGVGVFGSATAEDPVLSPGLVQSVTRRAWFWPMVGVLAGLMALFALWWLLIQLRTNRLTALTLRPALPDGRTTLRTEALATAVEEEIESYHGVTRAQARFSGAPAAARLTLLVTLDGRVGAGEIRRRIEQQALTRARGALGVGVLPTEVELVLPAEEQRDVR